MRTGRRRRRPGGWPGGRPGQADRAIARCLRPLTPAARSLVPAVAFAVPATALAVLAYLPKAGTGTPSPQRVLLAAGFLIVLCVVADLLPRPRAVWARLRAGAQARARTWRRAWARRRAQLRAGERTAPQPDPTAWPAWAAQPPRAALPTRTVPTARVVRAVRPARAPQPLWRVGGPRSFLGLLAVQAALHAAFLQHLIHPGGIHPGDRAGSPPSDPLADPLLCPPGLLDGRGTAQGSSTELVAAILAGRPPAWSPSNPGELLAAGSSAALLGPEGVAVVVAHAVAAAATFWWARRGCTTLTAAARLLAARLRLRRPEPMPMPLEVPRVIRRVRAGAARPLDRPRIAVGLRGPPARPTVVCRSGVAHGGVIMHCGGVLHRGGPGRRDGSWEPAGYSGNGSNGSRPLVGALCPATA